MSRRIARKAQKLGQAPGTLVHVGERKVERVRLRVIDYDAGRLEERELEGAEEAFPLRDSATVSWLNVDGLHDVELIRRIGDHFGLHPLVLEDVVNTSQRPKAEEHEDYLFLVLRMLTWDAARSSAVDEQFSIVLGGSWVLTFQERYGDVFDPLRERLRAGKGRARGRGADYLAYAVIDSVVDHYFSVLERLGDRVDALEEEVVTEPDPETLRGVYALRRDLLFVRRSVWPAREVLSSLLREEGTFWRPETRPFLRDVYDHTVQVIDTAETFRDVTGGLLDTYLSSVSNRMNEVMKVLTIMATIFIPLTFIAGIYGMNFERMPELGWRWGYPTALALMAVVAAGMLVYFRRKDWL